MMNRLLSTTLILILLLSLCGTAFAEEIASDGDLATEEPAVYALPAEETAGLLPESEPSAGETAALPEADDAPESVSESVSDASEDPAALTEEIPASLPSDEPAQDGDTSVTVIESVEFSIEVPAAGTVIEIGSYGIPSAVPTVSLPSNAPYMLEPIEGGPPALLLTFYDEYSHPLLVGTVPGGEELYAVVRLSARDGFVFSDSTVFSVTEGSVTMKNVYDDQCFLYITIPPQGTAISSISLAVADPEKHTYINALTDDDGDYIDDTQNPSPQVFLPENVHYRLLSDKDRLPALWLEEPSTFSSLFVGEIEPGASLGVIIFLQAEPGYYFDENVSVEVSGIAPVEISIQDGLLAYVLSSVEISQEMITITYDFNGGTAPEGEDFPNTVQLPYGIQFFGGDPLTDPGLIPPYGCHFTGIEIEGTFYPVGEPVEYTITKEVNIRMIYELYDPYSVVSGDGQTWTKGSTSTADFTVKRADDPEPPEPSELPLPPVESEMPVVSLAAPAMTVDGLGDADTFDLFTGIEVDGETVEASNYTASAGSLILKLYPTYLETLSLGEHTIEFFFEDNSTSAAFNVKAASAPPPASTPAPTAPVYSPKTADTSEIALWTLLFGCCAMGLAVLERKRRTDR